MWIVLAIVAYIFNAGASLIDKILLNDDAGDPVVYAFAVSVLSGVGILFAFFGASFISVWFLFVALCTAVVAFFALMYFFRALERQEASRVVPIVGITQPIVIGVLAYLFLGERLSFFAGVGVILCVFGGWFLTRDRNTSIKSRRYSERWLIFSLISGIGFSLMYVLSKYLYESVGFVNGFVWTRAFGLAVALCLLFSLEFRKRLMVLRRATSKTSRSFLFFFGQTCGAMYFVFIHYAISLGSVTIVNGLQSLQYVFVFLFSFLIACLRPKILNEDFSKISMLNKIPALILIIFGLIIFTVG